jgi:hypothetical protein
VNARQAKRVAASMLARYARGRADDGRHYLTEGFHVFAPDAVDPGDTERVASAFDELAAELERRLSGERKPRPPAIDLNQLSWLDIEVFSS